LAQAAVVYRVLDGRLLLFGLGENMEIALLHEMDLDECVALFRFCAPSFVAAE